VGQTPAYLRYLEAAQKIIEQVRATQGENLLRAAAEFEPVLQKYHQRIMNSESRGPR
jgi:hypothetical protein